MLDPHLLKFSYVSFYRFCMYQTIFFCVTAILLCIHLARSRSRTLIRLLFLICLSILCILDQAAIKKDSHSMSEKEIHVEIETNIKTFSCLTFPKNRLIVLQAGFSGCTLYIPSTWYTLGYTKNWFLMDFLSVLRKSWLDYGTHADTQKMKQLVKCQLWSLNKY